MCLVDVDLTGGGKGEGERNPWVNNMNNQNQVGNGGMLASALALAEVHPDFARLVVRGAVRSLPLSQGEYYPEGAYPEGPGYWGFGTGIYNSPHPHPHLNTPNSRTHSLHVISICRQRHGHVRLSIGHRFRPI